jgi:CO/xanthine dehydrogenase Mo-binding subunit
MVPSILDLPPDFGESVLEIDTLDVHGIGETSLPSVMPAVGNAVSRAIGARITSIPLTPEKVLKARNGTH